MSIFAALAVIILLMVLATVYAPIGKTAEGSVNLGSYDLEHLPGYLLFSAMRIFLVFWITFFLWTPIAHLLDVYSWQKFVKKLEETHNNSHVILLAGFFLASAILVKNTSATGFDAYLATLIFRGGIAILISTLLTTIVAYAAGVRSLAQFRQWIDMLSNDSHAYLVAAIFVGMMILLT